jgi:murein L,D-transpeptidase YcbB/YkuD
LKPLLLFILGWVYGWVLLPNGHAQPVSYQVREALRSRIEAGRTGEILSACDERIHASAALAPFYEARGYRPAWTDERGPRKQALELMGAIGEAVDEGLNPEDYHFAAISQNLDRLGHGRGSEAGADAAILADLELLLTDGFLIYATHLLSGRVNPETIDPEWRANQREADLPTVLERTLSEDRVAGTLRDLLPAHSGYAMLREALKTYRRIEVNGGWVKVPNGPKMTKGHRGHRVVELRKRLLATGDLEEGESPDGPDFDEALEQAVRRFQGRHGLDTDGVVGRNTLSALNVAVGDRLGQIQVNLERWRWLPQDLGNRYVLVNLADFKLEVVETGRRVMGMRIIVGKGYRRTPVFSGMMTYLVLNPTWHVPAKIARLDKLPLIRKDPGYLSREHFRVFDGWGAGATEIDPATIDWPNVIPRNFKYRLRQDPGPWNALGSIKFMFPNEFGVYIHDTPSRELFKKTVRTFSSGCIRIEKPVQLAEYVLEGDLKWNDETIMAALKRGQEQTVRLPAPIPVHLLYWTAWVGPYGTVQFRKDVYGRDGRVLEALRSKPPTLCVPPESQSRGIGDDPYLGHRKPTPET